MSAFSSFHTRSKANEGIRIKLANPDGTPTDHWLQIRSVWSDEHQAARSELIRMAVEHGKANALEPLPPKEERARSKEQDRLRRATCAASLIADWSNDEPLTQEAAIAFLLEARQVLVHIERIAEDDKRFFGN